MYRSGYNIMIPEEIDQDFVKLVCALMKEVYGDEEPHMAPSPQQPLRDSSVRF